MATKSAQSWPPGRARRSTQGDHPFARHRLGQADTLRREVFDQLPMFNQARLVNVLAKYAVHYNRHRPHRSRAQRPPDLHADPPSVRRLAGRRTRRKPILTGLINEYEHAA